MAPVRHVAIGAQPITALESVLGPPRYQAFAATAVSVPGLGRVLGKHSVVVD